MTKFDRIAVFNDTQEWIKRDKKLSESTKKTISSNIFYKDAEDISIDGIEKKINFHQKLLFLEVALLMQLEIILLKK